MKTAMQELIDWIECDNDNNVYDILDMAKELLEKEKKAIIHAFNFGENFSVDYFNPETPEVAPSVNYFIQSYQNK
jgi:1,4-alpha-glucan branching enzyme